MFLLRLFDDILICGRHLGSATLAATLVLSGCTPNDNTVTEALQSASGWLNEAEPPAPAREWQLSKQPGLEDRPFPRLSEVPPRPDDLSTPAAVTAKIDSLRSDNAQAGSVNLDRPTGLALGGPPPPRLDRLVIPSEPPTADTAGEPPYRTQPPRPQALPEEFAIRATPLTPGFEPAPDLTFATSSPGWFDAKARAAVTKYANEHANIASRVLLLMEGPAFSVDPVRPVYDQLRASGLPRERISVSHREAAVERILIQSLGE